MKSLTPTKVQVVQTASPCSSLAIDPSDSTIYAALETPSEVTITKSGQTIASFPSSLTSHSTRAVLDLHHFDDCLVLLLYNGDIATVHFADSHSEIVGSVDSGIKAAAWSPDGEQLVLITGMSLT